MYSMRKKMSRLSPWFNDVSYDATYDRPEWTVWTIWNSVIPVRFGNRRMETKENILSHLEEVLSVFYLKLPDTHPSAPVRVITVKELNVQPLLKHEFHRHRVCISDSHFTLYSGTDSYIQLGRALGDLLTPGLAVNQVLVIIGGLFFSVDQTLKLDLDIRIPPMTFHIFHFLNNESGGPLNYYQPYGVPIPNSVYQLCYFRKDLDQSKSILLKVMLEASPYELKKRKKLITELQGFYNTPAKVIWKKISESFPIPVEETVTPTGIATASTPRQIHTPKRRTRSLSTYFQQVSDSLPSPSHGSVSKRLSIKQEENIEMDFGNFRICSVDSINSSEKTLQRSARTSLVSLPGPTNNLNSRVERKLEKLPCDVNDSPSVMKRCGDERNQSPIPHPSSPATRPNFSHDQAEILQDIIQGMASTYMRYSTSYKYSSLQTLNDELRSLSVQSKRNGIPCHVYAIVDTYLNFTNGYHELNISDDTLHDVRLRISNSDTCPLIGPQAEPNDIIRINHAIISETCVKNVRHLVVSVSSHQNYMLFRCDIEKSEMNIKTCAFSKSYLVSEANRVIDLLRIIALRRNMLESSQLNLLDSEERSVDENGDEESFELQETYAPSPPDTSSNETNTSDESFKSASAVMLVDTG